MNKKRLVIYSVSFLLPILLLLICMLILHIFPFGNQSFLYWDCEEQHINFLSYFKSIFTTNNDFFYSFANLGGNNMLDFSAYYNYFSPLNIILFLFPDKYINIALELIMLIKIGLCGLTFSYFLTKEVKESYLSIIFALSYALSMHTLITTMTNVVLMDGIILLPLVIVGISKIIEKNDFKIYLISIFLTIITNAYMGYVSIIFSGLYFIVKIIKTGKINLKENLSKIWTYIYITILSVGLSAWLLLPAKYSLSGGKYEYFDILNRLFVIRENIIEIISKFYTCNLFVEFWEDPAPYIFVGILVIIMVILYFMNSAYNKRERIIDSIVLCFLFISFFINCLFVLWSMGVENPNGTIYRFSYIFIFYLLYLAYKQMLELSSTKFKDIIIASVIYTIVTLIVFCQKYQTIHNVILLFDYIIGLIILIMIELSNKDKIKNIKLISIVLFVCIHLINMQIHTNNVFISQRNCSLSQDINYFIEYRTGMKAALNEIRSNDNSFFRIASQETFVQRPEKKIYNNAQFLNQYDSFTGYSSLGQISTRNFYYYIGVPVFMYNMLFTYIDDVETYPVSLLGTKYIISSNPNLRKPYEKYSDIGSKFYIYKNPYCFPMAFLIEYNENLFENLYAKYPDVPDFQNNLIKILANKDFGNIFEYVKIALDEKISEYLNQNDGELDDFINVKYNEKETDNDNPYLLINSFGDIGMALPRVEIGEKPYNYFINDLNLQVQSLKDKITNNNIDLKFIIGSHYITQEDYISIFKEINTYVVNEKLDILEKYYEEIIKNSIELEKITSSHLKGKIDVNSDNKLVFMTVPYDEGWQIKINGKPRKAIKAFNSMIAIPIYSGETELEMKYVPKGLTQGLIITIISIIILFFSIIINYKKNKD